MTTTLDRFDFWSTDVRSLDHAELEALKQRLIRRGHAERARILSALVRAAIDWLRRACCPAMAKGTSAARPA